MGDFVLPGEAITTESGYLRGHGSYIKESYVEGAIDQSSGSSIIGHTLISSVAGYIERIDKLISVRPINSRYTGEVGDLIVGRITTVDSKRWKVDIASHRDAVLQLSSINLPDGVQRMRTYDDQLSMRTLFVENDLISAEIQNINSDGIISLHARSLKYGKLENGQLIIVPSVLIRRLPQHYVSLPYGIDVIIGLNGYVWISRTIPEEWKNISGDIDDVLDEMAPLAETLQRIRVKHRETSLTYDERLKVARTRNTINALAKVRHHITPDNIEAVYARSMELNLAPMDMLQSKNMELVTDAVSRHNE